jgi:hypothetical protein
MSCQKNMRTLDGIIIVGTTHHGSPYKGVLELLQQVQVKCLANAALAEIDFNQYRVSIEQRTVRSQLYRNDHQSSKIRGESRPFSRMKSPSFCFWVSSIEVDCRSLYTAHAMRAAQLEGKGGFGHIYNYYLKASFIIRLTVTNPTESQYQRMRRHAGHFI